MAFPFQMELTMEDQYSLDISGHTELLNTETNEQSMRNYGQQAHGQRQQDIVQQQGERFMQQRIMQMQLMQQQKMIQQQNTLMQQQQQVVDQPTVANHMGLTTTAENLHLNGEEEIEKQVEDGDIQGEAEEEGELTTTKYYGAEQFLKEEMKQVVMTKATEITLASILQEQKTQLIQEISAKEKVVDHMKRENELLKINAELSKNEIRDLQSRINSGKEICEKIVSFVQDERTNLDNVQVRLKKVYEDAHKLDSLRKDWRISSSKTLAKLEDEIKMKNDAFQASNNSDDIDKEIVELQLKIVEAREYKEILAKKKKELDLENVRENELEELQMQLKSKLDDIAEVELKKKRVVEEKNTNVRLLNKALEDREMRLKELEFQKVTISEKNDQVLKESEAKKIHLSEAQRKVSDLETEISEITKSINDHTNQLEQQQNVFRNQELVFLENIAQLEKSIAESKMKYSDERQKLQELNRNYALKMEEKANLLIEKFKLDKELLQRQTDEITLSALNKKIAKSEEKTNELQEQQKQLQEDTTVQVLVREKAYLETSLVYLNEKSDNTKKMIECESEQVKSYEDENTNLEERLKEIQKGCEAIETEIDLIKNAEAATPEPKLDTPVGILKAGPKLKSYPMSPKKVQFDQSQSKVHEFEQLSSESNVGDLYQQSSAVRLLDQLFSEMKKSQPQKSNMKRKMVDLDS